MKTIRFIIALISMSLCGMAQIVFPTGGGGGAGAPVGTVVNSGTPIASAIPIYGDTTGTNLSPSQITTTGLTNLFAGTVTVTNNLNAIKNINIVTEGAGIFHGVDRKISFGDIGVEIYGGNSDNVYLATGDYSHQGVESVKRTVSATTSDTYSSTIASNNARGPGAFTDNTGSTSDITITLPSPLRGDHYYFHISTNHFIIVNCTGTDTIQVIGSTITATTGDTRSTTVGNSIEVRCIQTTVNPKWIAVPSGTWTVN